MESRILNVAHELSNLAATTVYCGTKRGFTQAATSDEVTLIPCHSTDWLYPLDNWTFNKSITKTSDGISFDVYESHNVSGYLFLKTLKKKGRSSRFIATIHGPLADEFAQSGKIPSQTLKDRLANRVMNYLSKIERELVQDAQNIVTVSEYSSKKIVEYYDVDSSKIRIVPNGVDCHQFRPIEVPHKVKEIIGLSDKQCVLFVGQLIHRKGLNFLIEAAKEIVKERKNTLFLIVGDGPLRQRLIQYLEKIGLLSHFVFLGDVKGNPLVEIYNCADVFVLPSVTEGQGIVLLEAQAVGKPVVAFDVGAIRESIVSQETGFVVDPQAKGSLASAITNLLSDQELRIRMGEKGRSFICEKFSLTHCARKMLDTYREVAS